MQHVLTRTILQVRIQLRSWMWEILGMWVLLPSAPFAWRRGRSYGYRQGPHRNAPSRSPVNIWCKATLLGSMNVLNHNISRRSNAKHLCYNSCLPHACFGPALQKGKN
eukprot:1547192-Amphidinium_carterae.1